MQLEHEFTVPVPVDQAWDVLLDVERVAPCMPGATVESFDGEIIEGRVKVKVGPIQVTYAGTARFVVKDVAARRAIIDARAKEARGAGTARATITAVLHDEGGSATKVTVTTDLAITGRPAQFGRGVMVDVGEKILGRFAACLEAELSGSETTVPTSSAGATATPPPPPPLHRTPDNDAIDLFDTAGVPMLKRAVPLVGGLLFLLVLWRLLVHRWRHTSSGLARAQD